jgi:DNA-binding transcriptional MerR regulator
MNDRPYMSIGDVLTLLREEFPDITISKIRFLESRGLLVPERTPSGYRKFYDHDVERLRWILQQQREHFLPLKVIKGRLEGNDPGSERQPLFEVDSRDSEADDEAPAVAGPEAAEVAVAEAAAAEVALAEAEAEVDETRTAEVGSSIGRNGARGELEHVGARSGSLLVQAGGVTGERATPRHVSTQAPAAGPGQGAARSRGEGPAQGEPFVSPGQVSAGPPTRRGDGSEGTPREHRVRESPTTRPVPAASLAAASTRGAGAAAEARGGGQQHESGGKHRKESSAASPGASPAASPATQGHETGAPADAPATDTPASSAWHPSGSGKGRRRSRPSDDADMTASEVGQLSGLSVEAVEELESFGLIEGHTVAGVHCYGKDALEVATIAAQFARFGIEARHLRIFKHAAERQSGLYAQVVLPVLRQRNPEARQRALDDLARMSELGASLQATFVRDSLGDVTGA